MNAEPVVPFREAVKVWLRVALLSFGGPASQIAVMHRILVEEKKWIGEARFLHALNYCMLLPGPEAQQLATYIGWLLHKTRGGLTAGLLFIAPGFLSILALSLLYLIHGQQSWVIALFFGLKAAILAVVVEAVARIGKRALKNATLIAVAGAAFVAIFLFQAPFPLIVLTAAIFGFASHWMFPRLIPAPAHGPDVGEDRAVLDRAIMEGRLSHIAPDKKRALLTAVLWLALWFAPIAMCWDAFGPDHVFSRIALFFSQTAVVTFGGAYAVLAYVAQQAVNVYGWLTPGEMLDGLALAETTPGPLIMVLQFVGALAAARAETGLSPVWAGLIGSGLTVWVTFVPSFLWIFTGAPYVESLLGRRWLHAGLSCVTAAVVGVILNLSVWFALHVLFGTVTARTWGLIRVNIPDVSTLDAAAALIALGSMAAILRFRLGLGFTLAGAAVAGFIWKIAAG